MGESYVRPVVAGREPRPAWIGVWRFRVVVVLLIVLIAWGSLEFFRRYVDPNRSQDPGIGDENNVVESPAALHAGAPLRLRV
ncbi:MAG TPA: hypothetical protein VNA12_08485 [Mycobacteriales bacterium]|nr:hypothetical protein [Mycobacteriales bacterium]